MAFGRFIKITIVALLLGGVGVFLVWSHTVAPADATVLKKVQASTSVMIRETPRSFIVEPRKPSTVGLVFIPGAKIDPRAYAYKLSAISETLDITVVIIKPYFNLALFDFRPFSTFTSDTRHVKQWYVGGHSLGGVRACSYAADWRNDISGLLLFASYCQNAVAVRTLSLRGENDGLVSGATIRKYETNLTNDHHYYEIKNANHASFGDYGTQSGDGAATISSDTMRQIILDQVSHWISK